MKKATTLILAAAMLSVSAMAQSNATVKKETKASNTPATNTTNKQGQFTPCCKSPKTAVKQQDNNQQMQKVTEKKP